MTSTWNRFEEYSYIGGKFHSLIILIVTYGQKLCSRVEEVRKTTEMGTDLLWRLFTLHNQLYSPSSTQRISRAIFYCRSRNSRMRLRGNGLLFRCQKREHYKTWHKYNLTFDMYKFSIRLLNAFTSQTSHSNSIGVCSQRSNWQWACTG